jgi:GGDEF domain-containing protein
MNACPLACGTDFEPRVVEAGGVAFFICAECLGVAFDAAILTDQRRNIDLTRMLRPVIARIRCENSIDPLTQTKNRAFFFRRLAAEIRVASHRSFVSVAAFRFDLEELYADIDARRGDTTVRSLAASLISMVRSGDDLARVEPDTFGLILRNADVITAQDIASRIVNAAHVIMLDNDQPIRLQLLLEVAAADEKTPEDAWNDVVARFMTPGNQPRAEE